MEFSKLGIYLIYGKKGSGKSYFQARLGLKLIEQYYKIEKKYPQLPHRKYWSNSKYSVEIEKKELDKHLSYWTHVDELYNLRDSDIGWDEIGKDLPAGSWQDTPKELKQVFSHLRKRGNRLFANTQIFEDIDISFRRQIDRAFKVEKVFGSRDISATLPPVKFVYGLIIKREFNPLQIEWQRQEELREEIDPPFLERLKFSNYIPLQKKYVQAYDTQAELAPYRSRKLREWILECVEKDNCQAKDKFGNPHRKIIHEPI